MITLCLATFSAQAVADGPVASDPLFTALLTDGQSISGKIRQLGPRNEVAIVTPEGPERVFPLASLVKLTREGSSAPVAAELPVVLFPQGDRLYRTVIGAATDTALEVQSYSLSDRLSIPLESILGLVFSLPARTESDGLDTFLNRVREEPRNASALWLVNGDRLAGGFLGLSEKTIAFQPDKTPVKLDRAGVVALGFDPALVVYPEPAGPFLELTLSDGSRLGVSNARIEKGEVIATTRFGAKVEVPLAEISRVHSRTASVVPLSERPVAGSQYVPYVGTPRPYRIDSTIEGRPFRLSGRDFDRGIGMQSRTYLAYRLEPGDKRFQALVGLDDRAGPLGSVVFRVLVDSKEQFVSQPMSVRDAPRSIDVDLGGAKNLILISDFGERGGVRDLADWVEARIIR